MGRPRKITYINQREIAREFGVTTREILRWVEKGTFPQPCQIAGVTRLFDREAVKRFFRPDVGDDTATVKESEFVYFDHYIYFIECEIQNLIKIGHTKDFPLFRLRAIQWVSPVPLRLIGYTEGDLKEEGQLHVKFVHLRSHGEWFRGEEELRDFIREIAIPSDHSAWKPYPYLENVESAHE